MSSEPRTREIWRLSPHPKQWDLIDCPADIAIYGGRAGGGKSFALLAEPICRGLHEIPGFYGCIFRRTSKQVTEPGALWDQAGKIYPYVGGVAHVGAMEYRFPSGAKIAFRHCEHEEDKHSYAGSEICYLGFDELYTFTESQFTFLLSRNRSVCGVRPYVRATSNPHPGWLRTLLAPWVDPGWDGARAQSGEIKYQTRVKGKVRWVDETTEHAKSITFIEARLEDNPTLLDGDPGYVATLHSMLPIEQERLLHGNWGNITEGLVYPEAFDPLFEVIVEDFGPRGEQPLEDGGMDFGLTAPFVALGGFVDYEDVMWFSYERYVRGVTIPVHSEALPAKGIVKWQGDPAGAQEILQLRQAGHDVVSCYHVPTKNAAGETRSPKRSGIGMVRHRMRTGRLKIVRGRCPNLCRELGLYINDPEKPDAEEPIKQDDHAPDAMRYRVVGRDRGTYTASLSPRESEEERVTREEAERQADLDRKAELDRMAQEDPFDDRWFKQ
jgi:hypothetical protein